MVFPRVAILLAMWAPCSCFMVNQPVAPCPSIGGGALTSGAALFGAVLPSASRRCSELLMQKGNKPKKDMLELEGEVQEALPNAMFRVKLDDTEQVILCVISGKIRKNFIKILVGDHVTCEISPYDLTKGRITFRRR